MNPACHYGRSTSQHKSIQQPPAITITSAPSSTKGLTPLGTHNLKQRERKPREKKRTGK